MRKLLLGLFLLAVAPATAQAYSHYECMGKKITQSGSTITFQAAKNSFPEGGSRQEALNTVRSRWNKNPGRITLNDIQYGKTVGTKNDQDEIWYSNSESVMSGFNAVAKLDFQCYWWFGVHTKIKEVDVVLDNDDVDWSSSNNKDNKWPYGGSRFPARTALMHEIGHAVGLYHTNSTYNIMGSDATHVNANGSKIRSYVGEDGGHGAVFLYGATSSSNREDVSVSHWKYGDKSGEYSRHIRTGIFNPNQGNELQSSTQGGEPRYHVAAGAKILAEFTYENNGKNEKNPKIRFYISDNDKITTADDTIPFSTRTLTLKRNKVYTTKHEVRLPCDFDIGDQAYLGVIINFDDGVSEFTADNNATYTKLRFVNKLNFCKNNI